MTFLFEYLEVKNNKMLHILCCHFQSFLDDGHIGNELRDSCCRAGWISSKKKISTENMMNILVISTCDLSHNVVGTSCVNIENKKKAEDEKVILPNLSR